MPTRPTVRRLAATALCAALASTTGTVAASADPVSPEVRMAERTNPAVQFIETTFDASVSLRSVELNSAGLQLFHRGVLKYAAGELRNPSDVVEYTFERVRRDPAAYLRETGDRQTKKYSDTYRGSGFVASPDGYLVTARHVVTAGADVRKTFAAEGSASFAKATTKVWVKALAKFDLSDDAVEEMSGAFSDYVAAKVRVKLGTPKVSVVLGTADADGSRVGKSYPADVAYRSNADLGEDVAVVRVHLDAQLPALPLATAEAVQGDHIYLDGFPALPDGSEAALLQPTLTSGQITAIKDNGSGIRQPQTDATASGGSSGGPALNDAGQVVGILVSGAVNGDGGSLGQNYLMPLGSVHDALARSGASPAAGQTTTLYDEALDDFWADHYSRSLDEFRQVRDLFPAHAYAGSYIARAQAAIAAGKDVPVQSADVPWWPFGVGAVVLVLGSGVVLLVLRRRSRRPGPGSAGSAVAVPGAVTEPDEAVPFLPSWIGAADAAPVPVASMSTTAGPDLGPDPTPRPDDVVVVEDEVDEIPDWEPLDYVAAFPTTDAAPATD